MDSVSFLQLVMALLLIILAAKFAGYLSFVLGQPTVLGELLIGIILGPSVLNFLSLPYFSDEHLQETIAHLAELGVLLLMFIAGLELHVDELKRTGKVAALAGILGVLVPLILGYTVAILFSMDQRSSILVGLVLSATSVSISAQTLMELKVLRSRVGFGMMAAAVFDDILVILVLSIFFALSQADIENSWISILWIFVRMVSFLVLFWLVGMGLFSRFGTWIDRRAISKGLISFSFITMLLYAWAAEVMGSMAAITGAFMAGLLFSRTRHKERIESGISTIAYALFVPIFFVNVGLTADVRQISSQALLFFLAITVVAVVGKVGGAGWGARIAGYSRREALQLGVGMMSRGEVGLIVASVGIAEGVLMQEAYTSIVGMVIVTTLLTPPLLRSLFSGQPAQNT